ncbi:hypothetical protein J6590_100518 [Homalodisca vitripennis]|nr:hypothetical protein J6590_100518 [Homalodisca vitripennis]
MANKAELNVQSSAMNNKAGAGVKLWYRPTVEERSRRFRPRTTNTPSGAHGGIVQSRTEVDLKLTDFDKDKREAIVSLPRKMLVKYTAGNDCQH